MSTAADSANQAPPAQIVVRGNATRFLQAVEAGRHRFAVDEPLNLGGSDTAPDPYDYLMAALGACTSMTIGLYARRRKWPLEGIVVSLHHSRIHAKDCEDCETKEGMLDRIEADIELTGPLSPEQHSKLMEAAARCPVHRTLTSEVHVQLRCVKEPLVRATDT